MQTPKWLEIVPLTLENVDVLVEKTDFDRENLLEQLAIHKENGTVKVFVFADVLELIDRSSFEVVPEMLDEEEMLEAYGTSAFERHWFKGIPSE